MRIAILSLDTRGGIVPYIALGLGLQHAGHDVRMVAPSDFAPMFAEWGLPAAPLAGDIESALRQSGGAAEKGAIASMLFVRQQLARCVGQWTQETLDACAGVDALMGGIGGMVVGLSVAEKLRVPFLAAHLHPVDAPTAAFPGILFPAIPTWLGGHVLRWSHTVSELVLWAPFRAAIARARSEVLQLPARRRPPPRDLPVLYGFSPHVIPPPPDWGPFRHVTGYWNLPAGPDWSPSPELAAFLAAGPAPVCLGFGSMSSHDPRAVSELLLAAVRRAGVRAILLSGWGGLAEIAGPDIHVAAAIPHDWLYPRCAAAVHHGGAGTTGAAMRAGIPAVVVPFTMDQPFWAARVAALGVGPRPVARKRLTADSLAAALREATGDPAMRERAAALGARLRAEDGVAEAVRHVDAFARQSGL